MMTPYAELPTLHLHVKGGYFEPRGDWYRNFEYAAEQARGLDFHEDLYSPAPSPAPWSQGETCYFIAAASPPRTYDPGLMVESERRRRTFLMRGWEQAPEGSRDADQGRRRSSSLASRAAARRRRRASWPATTGSRTGAGTR